MTCQVLDGDSIKCGEWRTAEGECGERCRMRRGNEVEESRLISAPTHLNSIGPTAIIHHPTLSTSPACHIDPSPYSIRLKAQSQLSCEALLPLILYPLTLSH